MTKKVRQTMSLAPLMGLAGPLFDFRERCDILLR